MWESNPASLLSFSGKCTAQFSEVIDRALFCKIECRCCLRQPIKSDIKEMCKNENHCTFSLVDFGNLFHSNGICVNKWWVSYNFK